MHALSEFSVTIEALADKLEVDLAHLQTCWSEIPDEERAAVILGIVSHAPGVARLLCPQFGRFTNFGSAGHAGANRF